MPELPEVETIVRKLRLPLIGHSIVRAWTDWPRAAYPSAQAIFQLVPGHRIEDITRRGKYIVFTLSLCRSAAQPTHYLLIHLKMSGRLDVLAQETPRDRHVHFVFALDNGYELRFNDVRKFGRVYLVDDVSEITGMLGPEPLDAAFTLPAFRRLIAGKTGALKPLLLDQTFIAGLGNIYADETLWRARLYPLRRADSLSRAEVAALYHSIRQTLTDALRYDGTAFDQVYPGGRYQDRLRVYGRAGQPCRRCRAAIQRIVIGQRGTHFCPRCQSPRQARSKRSGEN